MSAPDLTTEVVGYRQWYVTPDLELRSAGVRGASPWQRGDQTAICHRVRRDVSGLYETYPPSPDPCGDCPGPECNCGFYALHSPSDHWYGKSSGLAIPESDPLVSGVIVAWGALQVHYQGFRAQHARIAALALPSTKRDQVTARAVASAYGVPCVPSQELPRIAAEFGGTVPVELRPAKPEPKKDIFQQSLQQAYVYFNPFASSAFWTSSHYPGVPLAPPQPQPSPKVSAEARKRMELLQGIKQPSNRQGPTKPKRAPKRLP